MVLGPPSDKGACSCLLRESFSKKWLLGFCVNVKIDDLDIVLCYSVAMIK